MPRCTATAATSAAQSRSVHAGRWSDRPRPGRSTVIIRTPAAACSSGVPSASPREPPPPGDKRTGRPPGSPVIPYPTRRPPVIVTVPSTAAIIAAEQRPGWAISRSGGRRLRPFSRRPRCPFQAHRSDVGRVLAGTVDSAGPPCASWSAFGGQPSTVIPGAGERDGEPVRIGVRIDPHGVAVRHRQEIRLHALVRPDRLAQRADPGTGKGGADGPQAPAARERFVVVRTALTATQDERHHAAAAVLVELQPVVTHV